MEGELWKALYALLAREAKQRIRRCRVVYSDELILLVFFWSVLHDRPRSWACQSCNWPSAMRWLSLPSEATISRRLRSVSVLLLTRVYQHLAQLHPPAMMRRMDSKPLVVGGFSKDRDAKRGYGAGQLVRGYKLFCLWGQGVVPDALLLGPMNQSDPQAAATLLRNVENGGGYLLGDINYDSNALHALATAGGWQLLAPRKHSGAGLGHCHHQSSRLRSIQLLEGPSDFGRRLYRLRSGIEREFGQCGNFGGGLQPLPNWVRRPHRLVPWVISKLIFNGLRQCRNQRLTA